MCAAVELLLLVKLLDICVVAFMLLPHVMYAF